MKLFSSEKGTAVECWSLTLSSLNCLDFIWMQPMIHREVVKRERERERESVIGCIRRHTWTQWDRNKSGILLAILVSVSVLLVHSVSTRARNEATFRGIASPCLVVKSEMRNRFASPRLGKLKKSKYSQGLQFWHFEAHNLCSFTHMLHVFRLPSRFWQESEVWVQI
jgi:hypothetical protein